MYDTWKLLAPVDLRTEAEARVRHARAVSGALGADLTLLYVPARRAGQVHWPVNAVTGSVQRAVREGPFAPTLAHYAADSGADMLVLAAKPHPPWTRLWSTPRPAQIAAATDLPICFTRLGGPLPQSGFRSILCELKLDGADEPVVRFSQELASHCDATLIFLHVLPEVSEALAAYGLLNLDDRPLSEQVALQRFEQMTKGLSQPYLTAVETGPAARVIAAAARERAADVVITSRKQAAAACGHAARVLAWLACPLITVPVEPRSLLQSPAARRRQLVARSL